MTAQQATPGQHHGSVNRQQQAPPRQAEAGVSHLHRPGQLQPQAEQGQEAGAGMEPAVGLANAPGRLVAAVHQTLLDGSLHHVKASLAHLLTSLKCPALQTFHNQPPHLQATLSRCVCCCRAAQQMMQARHPVCWLTSKCIPCLRTSGAALHPGMRLHVGCGTLRWATMLLCGRRRQAWGCAA